MRKKLLILSLIVIALMYAFRADWLVYMGSSLIRDAPAKSADVAIVLSTGVGYIPRLLQAAQLYREKRVKRILINGNRKTDTTRKLEQQGFVSPCKWYDNSLRILEMYGVPREKVWTVSAEDVFDTVSEAQTIKPFLKEKDVNTFIITTSKFHTRRALYVWRKVLGREEGITTSAATEDPFDPDSWWQHGRQVKQVMGEYGGMAYYLWKQPWK